MTNETTAITNQQVLADHSDERAEATARAGEDAGPATSTTITISLADYEAGLLARFLSRALTARWREAGRTDFSALELGLLGAVVAELEDGPAAGAEERWELGLACDHAVHEVTGIAVLPRAVARGLPKRSRDRDTLDAIATHAHELAAELTRAPGIPAPGTRRRRR